MTKESEAATSQPLGLFVWPFALLVAGSSWILRRLFYCPIGYDSWVAVLVHTPRKRPQQFFAFFLANVIVGLIGVWVQVLTPMFAIETTLETEIVKTMRSGNLYTFAIAFLVSTSMFVLIEYVEKTESEFRELKTNGFLVSIVLIISLCVIAGMQALAQAKEPAAAKALQFSTTDFVQLLLTILSILCGLYLYCLTQINQLKELFGRLKDGGRTDLRNALAAPATQEFKLNL